MFQSVPTEEGRYNLIHRFDREGRKEDKGMKATREKKTEGEG
jgi:hypothetical protein